MLWKFVCDLRFHEVLQTTIIRQIRNELKKSKNTVKNRWNFEQIFMCACVCVWVIVAYYCVWMYIYIYI